jgi:hypothetical protein
MDIRGKFCRTSIATLLPLSLAGCVSPADSDERQQASASERPTISESPEAVVTATPQQVASVIAGMEGDWREVVDEAGECRFTWVLGDDDDPADRITGMTCYMRETTIGYTAQTAMESLADLNVPDSMSSLVDETNMALQNVVDVDLEPVCGEATEGPNDSKPCDRALGQRMGAYSSLENVLDKWGPYL